MHERTSEQLKRFLNSWSYRRIPVRRTITIHVFVFCIKIFNICLILFQLFLRTNLPFGGPLFLWLDYRLLRYRWELFFFCLAALCFVLCSGIITTCIKHITTDKHAQKVFRNYTFQCSLQFKKNEFILATLNKVVLRLIEINYK